MLIKERLLTIMCILSVPILNVVYTLMNGGRDRVHCLTTKIDDMIPFVKVFILPYSLWYPFIITSLIYLCINNKKVFYRTILSIDIGLICCYITYIFFQTTVPRPELNGTGLFVKMISITYKLDEPYNCFPSIHVLTSYIICKSFKHNKTGKLAMKVFAYIFSAIIIVSTLFVKQHVILDLISAAMLGEVIYSLAGFISKKIIKEYIMKVVYSFTFLS